MCINYCQLLARYLPSISNLLAESLDHMLPTLSFLHALEVSQNPFSELLIAECAIRDCKCSCNHVRGSDRADSLQTGIASRFQQLEHWTAPCVSNLKPRWYNIEADNLTVGRATPSSYRTPRLLRGGHIMNETTESSRFPIRNITKFLIHWLPWLIALGLALYTAWPLLFPAKT